MAEGGEGIPVYKTGQPIETGESFILKPGEVYKPQIDRNPRDVVVQDKVPIGEPTLSMDEQIKTEQLEGARALLRDLPANASQDDKHAAEKLLEEAIANTAPAEEADPNARAAWVDSQNAKKPSNTSETERFGWIKKLFKKTG